MLRRLLLLFLLVAPLAMHAQTYAVIVGSNVGDGGGAPLQSGKLCFTPGDINGNPLGIRGAGQITTKPQCVPVTAGVISPVGGTFKLLNTATSYPSPFCWSATLQTNAGTLPSTGYGCIQMNSSWCSTVSGTYTCNFDSYPPNSPAQAPVVAPNFTVGTVTSLSPGASPTFTISGIAPNFTVDIAIPAGFTGATGATPTFSIGSVTTLPAGTPATVTISGSSPTYTLNLGIPQGPAGPGLALAAGVIGQGYTSDGTSAVPTFDSPFYTVAGLTLYGDSITKCVGPTYCSQGYAQLLMPLFGNASSTDLGVAGDMVADTVRNQIFPKSNERASLSTNNSLMIGTNDIGVCGGSTGCMTNYQYGLQAAVSDLLIPEGNKLFGQSCTTTSGTTVADNTIPGTPALGSTTNGTVITCVTPSGGAAVDVAWRAIDGNAGVATVAIDGTVVDTLNAFGNNGVLVHTQANTNDTVYAKEYSVTTASSHTVVFTVTSATSASNLFSVVYVASPLFNWTLMAPPHLLLADVPSPNNSTTVAYNAIVQTIFNQYHGDGLPIQHVSTYNPSTYAVDYAIIPANISGRTLTDVAITAGSNTVTSASANFGPNSVGKMLVIQGAGAGSSPFWLDELITAYVNQTTVTVATAATNTVTGATTYYGSCGQVTGLSSNPHPNCLGDIHLRDAFLKVVHPVTQQPANLSPNPSFTGTMAGQMYSDITGFSSLNANPIPPQHLSQDSVVSTTVSDWRTNSNAPFYGILCHFGPARWGDVRIDTAPTASVFSGDCKGNITGIGTAQFFQFASASVRATFNGTTPIYLFVDANVTSAVANWQTNLTVPVLGFNVHYVNGNIMEGRIDGAATPYWYLSGQGSWFGRQYLTNPVTVSTGPTPGIDVTKGFQSFTLSANAVPTTTGTPVAGAHIVIQVCNPVGSTWSWIWPAIFHVSGSSTITLAANTCLVQPFNSFNGTTFLAEGQTGLAP